MVTRLQVIDVGPHVFDDARALVAEQKREPSSPAIDTVGNVQVGVTNPRGAHADRDLTATGRVHQDLFH